MEWRSPKAPREESLGRSTTAVDVRGMTLGASFTPASEGQMHRSLLAGTLCQELPVTAGQRNIPREPSSQLWIILESSRDSRSLTTNPGPSEPLKVSPRLQCRSTRVSTLVELEGTAVLVCYE